jgi:hypothetical protein
LGELIRGDFGTDSELVVTVGAMNGEIEGKAGCR